ncbi:MAG: flagellar hook-associated protein FlgK [Candidatus Magnetoovum sp. WYHC-5]|nr:flagellar hook-associated protein FlgK [Candidatus Magnetoovum sp. WYHC-5]
MPISNFFYIGNSALTSSKTALEVTSNNIANVNTEEYHRQDVILKVANPISRAFYGDGSGTIGSGVNVLDIRRRFDQYLENQYLQQTQNVGKYTVLENAYSLIEEFVNEQQDVGLEDYITEFFDAWNELSASPTGQTQRTVLMSKAQALITRAQDIEGKMEDIQDALDTELPVIVDKINDIADQIIALNEQIAPIEASGTATANDLRDRRDGLLLELASYVDFQTVEDDSGRVTVMVGERNLVSGGYTVHDMTMETSVDDKVVIEIEGIDITSKLTKGRLGGILELRNSDTEGVPGMLTELRTLISAIENETNIIQSTGFGLNAQQSDYTITDNTPASTTTGVIASSTITDFTNFTPGDYRFNFTASNTYDVYRNGQLLSSGNAYTTPTISINGMDVTFSTDPAANDSFYASAIGNNFFQPLSVYTLNKSDTTVAPNSQITSATIYDRTALTYKEYEVRFTSATDYELYDMANGTTTTGTLNTANAILVDGMEITFSTVPQPGSGNIFLISPIRESISNGSMILTDSDQVAAASTYDGLPGDNTNALAVIDMSNTQLSALSNKTISEYYNALVTNAGTKASSAQDTLEFDQQLLYSLKQKRDSVSAVNLDDEAMNIIRYQKAFEAAARIIQTADDLFEVLVNLGR